MNRRIVILGAGKVGQALVNAWCAQSSFEWIHWYNRSSREVAESLATRFGISFSTEIKQIPKRADLYVIAVADKAIVSTAEQLRQHINSDQLVVHTSGATEGSVLQPFFHRSGVFYPLQTFSEERQPLFQKIPICVEATSEEDLELLQELGRSISDKVVELSSSQRKWLHVAAVLVNNFVNQLYSESYDLLKKQEIPFSLLIPLIEETTERLQAERHPAHWQTGPAVRNDTPTLSAHLALLQEDPALQEIYQLLSQRIQANPK